MSTEGQSLGVVGALFRRMELSYRVGLMMVLVVTVLSHVPSGFNTLSTDDYLIRAMTMGSEALVAQDLSMADPNKPWLQRIGDAFHFYSPDAGSLQEYRRYGNLPWWSGEEAKMNPFRPLSAVTHWVDYQIAPASIPFQTFHSLIYLLLFAFSAYRLFWRLSPQASVAVLASLLLMVDYSLSMSFSWVPARNVFIAGALGCAMLERFLAWRTEQRTGPLLASLGFFVVGLLAAESTIALGGYLFAYLWLVEKRSLLAIARALLPYAVLVLSWRFAYNWLGYGASGISLYVDPGRDPMGFLTALVTTLPMLLASPMTTLDGMVTVLSPAMRPWLVVVCSVVALGALVVLRPLLKQNANVRFLLLGSILAGVPAAALVSAGPRGTVFICIGFFWIFALWLHSLMQGTPKRATRWLVMAVLSLHLVLPFLGSFVITSQVLPISYANDQQFYSVERAMREAPGERSLVVVNGRAPNNLYYVPFEWHFEYGVVPASMNLMAPGLVTFDLTRVSERQFELAAPQGLPLWSDAPILGLEGEAPIASQVYGIQMLQGLFTAPDPQYTVGSVWRAGDMRVTVRDTLDGRPSALLLEFHGDRHPDQMAWQWYDWSVMEYRAMAPLAVGETRRFDGPLDTHDRVRGVAFTFEEHEPAAESGR